jgi:hypothetical protein
MELKRHLDYVANLEDRNEAFVNYYERIQCFCY